MFHDTRFTDMKPSLGKDLVKITYKIKPKGMSMSSGKSQPEDEMENDGEQEGALATKLRDAADLVDEGSYEEAMNLIEEASEMCSEHCGSEDESEMD